MCPPPSDTCDESTWRNRPVTAKSRARLSKTSLVQRQHRPSTANARVDHTASERTGSERVPDLSTLAVTSNQAVVRRHIRSAGFIKAHPSSDNSVATSAKSVTPGIRRRVAFVKKGDKAKRGPANQAPVCVYRSDAYPRVHRSSEEHHEHVLARERRRFDYGMRMPFLMSHPPMYGARMMPSGVYTMTPPVLVQSRAQVQSRILSDPTLDALSRREYQRREPASTSAKPRSARPLPADEGLSASLQLRPGSFDDGYELTMPQHHVEEATLKHAGFQLVADGIKRTRKRIAERARLAQLACLRRERLGAAIEREVTNWRRETKAGCTYWVNKSTGDVVSTTPRAVIAAKARLEPTTSESPTSMLRGNSTHVTSTSHSVPHCWSSDSARQVDDDGGESHWEDTEQQQSAELLKALDEAFGTTNSTASSRARLPASGEFCFGTGALSYDPAPYNQLFAHIDAMDTGEEPTS